MQTNRKLRLRLFAFLMVCALLIPRNGFITAAAEQTQTVPVTAQAVALNEGATVLTEAEPAPDGLSPDSATGYIEKDLVAETPEETIPSESTGLSYQEAMEQRRQVVAMLESFLGTRYVWGGIYPGGFDCSGLVYYIYYLTLGYEISRCADTQMLNDGTPVTKDNLQPGDLVFFRDPGSPWVASHVGIYVGNRQMIHASNSGVCYSSVDSDYYASRYVGARRIIQVDNTGITTEIPTLNLR